WLTAVDGLPAVHEALRQVAVLNRDAVQVIRQQDGPETLLYVDPPYLHTTRGAPDVYAHEMTQVQHAELIDALLGCRGKVMLSGYPSEMYDTALSHWRREVFDLPNNAAGGDAKAREQEVVWLNFPAAWPVNFSRAKSNPDAAGRPAASAVI